MSIPGGGQEVFNLSHGSRNNGGVYASRGHYVEATWR